MEIQTLNQGLTIISETESNREATRVAGWLNYRYGYTSENRREIQVAVMDRYKSDDNLKTKLKRVE